MHPPGPHSGSLLWSGAKQHHCRCGVSGGTRANGSIWLLFNPFTTQPKECPQGTPAAQCKAMGANWQNGPSFGKPLSATSYQLPRTISVSFGVRF